MTAFTFAPINEDHINKFLADVTAVKTVYNNKQGYTSSIHAFSFHAEPGRKYVRIVRKEGSSQSVHCFLELETGLIFKAASWKVPAKHARGSIHAPDGGMSCIGPYGAAYLR